MAVEITDELEALRAEAAALGVAVDGRWGEARLCDEIAAVVNAGAAPADAQENSEGPDDVLAPMEAPYVRAGGHIDRGDGRGWMPEGE